MDTNLNRRAAEEVDEAARHGLLTQLDSANFRISEIEAELKRTRRERDEADRKARSLETALLEAMQPESGYLRSEAGRVAALMTRMSVMQRRDFWLSKLAHIGVSGELQWLYPHGGGADPLSMLIVGSGGFGDVLCLTPVIRALRQAWPGARIFVAHQHSGVEMLRESPYVNGVARARKILDQFAALDAQRLGDARFVDLGALAQKAERMLRPDGGFELLFTSQTVARDAETHFGPAVAAPASLAPAGGAP